jgi:hypothetical protein
MINMGNRKNPNRFAVSEDEIRTWYTFEGPLGAHDRRCFFAWKEGCLVGTYNAFVDAMESLASKQAKDTVRTRTDGNAGAEGHK